MSKLSPVQCPALLSIHPLVNPSPFLSSSLCHWFICALNEHALIQSRASSLYHISMNLSRCYGSTYLVKNFIIYYYYTYYDTVFLFTFRYLINFFFLSFTLSFLSYPQLLLVAVVVAWHDLDNSEYDCWPLDKPDEWNMIDCGGAITFTHIIYNGFFFNKLITFRKILFIIQMLLNS